MDFVLASTSPRRIQMFRDLKIEFRVQQPQVLEKRLHGEPGIDFARRLARQKAEDVAYRQGWFDAKTGKFLQTSQNWAVLGADTIVLLDKTILVKPRDKEDAVRMLRKLSGTSHNVVTGFHWIGAMDGIGRVVSKHVSTSVVFTDRPLSFWKWYVETGEPMDKAGAYAAQGIGMSFIERVSGSYANVVGLPLSHVLDVFSKIFKKDLCEICRKIS